MTRKDTDCLLLVTPVHDQIDGNSYSLVQNETGSAIYGILAVLN